MDVIDYISQSRNHAHHRRGGRAAQPNPRNHHAVGEQGLLVGLPVPKTLPCSTRDAGTGTSCCAAVSSFGNNRGWNATGPHTG